MRMTKRTAIMAALIAFSATGATIATATAAEAFTITGSGTSVTFSGTGGDFVTQDQTWSFDPSNASIDAIASPDGNSVGIAVTGSTTWQLGFAAPQGQALTAGTVYDNAARLPFQGPDQPGLTLSGNGAGCNTLTGSFTVKSATFGAHGWIQNLDITFVQHCEGDPNSAATGEVILNNGPAPPDLTVTVATAPTAQVSHAGGSVQLTGTVTCNRATTVSLNGSLLQRLNRTKVNTSTWFVASLTCGPAPTPWSVTVLPGSLPFGPGKAEVAGSFFANDPLFSTFVNGSFTQQVKLANN